MGWRFHKSTKIGPFRLNFSKKGVGWSVGAAGVRYTQRADGRRTLTSTIRGTGISYVTDLGRATPKSQPDHKLLDQASTTGHSDFTPASGGSGSSGGGKRPGHGCLWWVGAILFSPIYLSVWFWRSHFISNKALKAIILAIVWLGPLIVSGTASERASLPISSIGSASSIIEESSEVQEEEAPLAESTPANESVYSQGQQEAAVTSEPSAPAASESAPAASSEAAAAPAPAQSQQQEVMVWIPTHGGTKYHSRSSCSGMENPQQVTLEEAQALGFTPCKRCH